MGCLFFVCMVLPGVAGAQSVEELNLFHFGVLAIPGNSAVSEVQLPRSGRNVRVTGTVVIVSQGSPGRYLLSGLPPSTPVDVAVNDAELRYAGAGGSEKLSVGQYDTENVVTNSQGEAEILVGGSLQTSGENNPYEDGPYRGTTRLFLTYWDRSIGEYVTKSFSIDIGTDVRTSVSIEEAAAMSFGTIFARATAEGEAEFRLAPDGKFSIVNRGNARLVSLSKPQPAVLEVSGAAPNRKLNIELPADDEAIILRHTKEPAAPYFVLNQFVSEPSETGRTDEAGILEISIGGTLSTQPVTEEIVYPAGSYEATYDITVSY